MAAPSASRIRYLILILSTTCLTLTCSNSLILNFTVICMNDVVEVDSAHNMTEDHWLESPSKKSTLFSAIAVGSLIGTIPLMFVMQRYGTRISFTIYGMISAVSTLALPAAVDFGGFWAVVIMRLLQGVAIAINYPLLGSICEEWSPLDQSSFYIAILSCHLQFAAMLTMPVSGALCESPLGWRSAYYFMGFASVFFFIIYFLFYKNNPAMHRKVSVKELSRIQSGKDIKEGRETVPYKAILKTPVIIGILLASIGGNGGFQLFFLYGPSYMNKAMGMEVRSTGLATALPYLLSFLVKFFAGPLSDHTRFVSDTAKIIIFTSLSQGVMAACILGLAWTKNLTIAQICYTAAIGASGLNIVGQLRCAQLVARQFTHFVMAVVTLLNCFLVLLIPVVVAILAPENTVQEWSRIFYLTAGMIVLTNIYFLFTAESTAAPWTKTESQTPPPLEKPPLQPKDSLIWSTQPNDQLAALRLSEPKDPRLQNILAINNPRVF